MSQTKPKLRLSLHGRDYEEEEVVEVAVPDSWDEMDERSRNDWCNEKAKGLLLEHCTDWEDWEIVDAKTPIKGAIRQLRRERNELQRKYSVETPWFEKTFYNAAQRAEAEMERDRRRVMTPVERAEENLEAAIEREKQKHAEWLEQYEKDQRRLNEIPAEIAMLEEELEESDAKPATP